MDSHHQQLPSILSTSCRYLRRGSALSSVDKTETALFDGRQNLIDSVMKCHDSHELLPSPDKTFMCMHKGCPGGNYCVDQSKNYRRWKNVNDNDARAKNLFSKYHLISLCSEKDRKEQTCKEILIKLRSRFPGYSLKRSFVKTDGLDAQATEHPVITQTKDPEEIVGNGCNIQTKTNSLASQTLENIPRNAMNIPVKGILKSSSQSSYSTSSNGEQKEGTSTPRPNCSIQESNERGVCKKKVHFRENISRKTVLPSVSFHGCDFVFEDISIQSMASPQNQQMATSPYFYNERGLPEWDVSSTGDAYDATKTALQPESCQGCNTDHSIRLDYYPVSPCSLHRLCKVGLNNTDETGASKDGLKTMLRRDRNRYQEVELSLSRICHNNEQASKTGSTDHGDRLCCRDEFCPAVLLYNGQEPPCAKFSPKIHEDRKQKWLSNKKSLKSISVLQGFFKNKKILKSARSHSESDRSLDVDEARSELHENGSPSPREKTQRIIEWLEDIDINGNRNEISFLIPGPTALRRHPSIR